ncbi:TPA: restriction endonuclease subunit S [Vibrio parahaemolyticus]|uniref:restriction endonuclease subunit S n=1 Tax=Vibrio parahaemolyticus TaxID=670 RepID=UPI0012AC7F7E|nr:restriction endonuclease subunit S [Vibrio parahaemolyticus]EHR6434468.1 restriction endonuclease subunit S [Vibrio parahaemolyticus]HAS6532507.1 restriction endonuclease subunit S [Vibrio parahaemolyticus]HAS6552099.1 restriction endonuclease subunit S [Vibrio parahaemolyticus]HAS6555856.1 restriction endonuclease subunit S [Vibrio parahaemolyticus]
MSKEYNKALIPERRFPDFMTDESWKIMSFGEAFSRITTKNAENNTNVLTISAQHGLVSQTEYFKRSVAAKDLTGYYLLQKGDFAYNKSYSKGYPMGAIKPLKLYEQGVVSTLYICFKTKNGFSSDYFEHYFESGSLNSEVSKIAQEGGRAHGLLNVSVKEFFRDVRLMVPTLPEQQKIADFLSSVDELIAAEERKLDEIRAHKKGLMQRLLPTEGETKPKERFSQFVASGEWSEQKLGNKSLKVGSGITPKGGDKNYKREGRPFVRSQNIGWGQLLLDDIAYIDEETHSTFLSSEIILDDVLLNITGASIGRCAIANDFLVKGNVNQHVCIIRLDKAELNPSYLCQYILSDRGQSQIDSFQAGGNRQGLNFGQIRSFSIPVPPTIQEQEKIANCLSSIDVLVNCQMEKIGSLKAHKKALVQQLFPSIEEVGI